MRFIQTGFFFAEMNIESWMRLAYELENGNIKINLSLCKHVFNDFVWTESL